MHAYIVVLFALGIPWQVTDGPAVTLQIRNQHGVVLSTRSVTLPEEKRALSLTRFLQSFATTPCQLIQARACTLGAIYRIRREDGAASEILHCESPDPLCDPSARVLQDGDILVFYQGGYCCGY